MTLRYRLTTNGYDADECGEALVAIDGVIVKELERYCGRGHDSGWRQITFSQGLDAGTHTLTIGGYGNKKTGVLERADVYFDDILIIKGSAPIFESNCKNGVDDDGDGFVDCADSDCEGSPDCITTPETECSNGVDDDGDGFVDCLDPDCRDSEVCSSEQILSADFSNNSNGFVYRDDMFRSTSQPVYASGNYTSTGGYSGGGGLQVVVGGVDSVDIFNGMSGGWSAGFSLSQASSVQVTLRYRLTTNGYDADECGEVLVAIDGVIVKELEKYCGRGHDSGWRQITFSQGLDAGTHTLTIGGYGNKKTGPKERSDVYFDDVGVAISSEL